MNLLRAASSYARQGVRCWDIGKRTTLWCAARPGIVRRDDGAYEATVETYWYLYTMIAGVDCRVDLSNREDLAMVAAALVKRSKKGKRKQ